jgi:hypothetical protein
MSPVDSRDPRLEAEIASILARVSATKLKNPLEALVREIATVRLQTAELKASLQAVDALERLNDLYLPIAKEIGLADHLVDSLVVDMRFPLPPECGLYHLEYDAAGNPFRWTGAEPHSDFKLPLRRTSELHIRIEVPFGVTDEVLASFICAADYVDVPLERRGVAFVGRIPPVPDKLGPTRLRFQTTALVTPTDINPEAPDKRAIGVALSKIVIEPA